jgi:hypothetical protein
MSILNLNRLLRSYTCEISVRTSETSVDNHFTRQYNPEDSSELYIHIWFFENVVLLNVVHPLKICLHTQFRGPTLDVANFASTSALSKSHYRRIQRVNLKDFLSVISVPKLSSHLSSRFLVHLILRLSANILYALLSSLLHVTSCRPLISSYLM